MLSAIIEDRKSWLESMGYTVQVAQQDGNGFRFETSAGIVLWDKGLRFWGGFSLFPQTFSPLEFEKIRVVGRIDPSVRWQIAAQNIRGEIRFGCKVSLLQTLHSTIGTIHLCWKASPSTIQPLKWDEALVVSKTLAGHGEIKKITIEAYQIQ